MRKFVFVFAFASVALFACKEELPIVDDAALEPFRAAIDHKTTLEAFLEEGNRISSPLVNLGRMLFYEKRLSVANDISCNTCHDLANFGVDSLALSPGHLGQLGDRNSPTVYNASMQFVQFWDGREPTVEAQALGPILNPVEMAMPNAQSVVTKLKSIRGYLPHFLAAFPDQADPIAWENIGKAIGAFERRLITPTRFHAFLAGDSKALTEKEQRGLKVFLDVGCASCHLGPGVGGTVFRRLGTAERPWLTTDLGLGGETGDPAHNYSFKVPTLLNVAQTAPYSHNGQVATLEEMVKKMADYQNGKVLTEAEVNAIVTFLNTLTGEIPAEFIKEPPLPE